MSRHVVTKAEDTTWHEDPNGYTVGDSEGSWTRVPSGNMKYENRAPMHFGAPTSQRYRDNFDAIDWGRKPDPNPVALKEYQQWATAADEPRDVATIRRIEDGWVRYRQITHDGWGGNDDLPEAEFRAKFHVLLGRWG